MEIPLASKGVGNAPRSLGAELTEVSGNRLMHAPQSGRDDDDEGAATPNTQNAKRSGARDRDSATRGGEERRRFLNQSPPAKEKFLVHPKELEHSKNRASDGHGEVEGGVNCSH